MDSIKNTTTNATAISGYAVISYRTFSTAPTSDTAHGRSAGLEGLSAVEARLRELRRTVFLDRLKLVLWLFEPGTSPPAIDHGSLQSQELGGLQLLPQSEGEFKAAELAKAAARPSAAGLSGPNAGNLRAIQAANARAFQSNAQQSNAPSGGPEIRKDDPVTVYECFMAAVIASVSFHLSRFHHMIPLNYRTFVSFPKATALGDDDGDSDDDNASFDEEACCLFTTIDAHLSTSGTLVISTSTENNVKLYQLEKSIYLTGSSEDFLGELVRVAPNGAIARYIGVDVPSLRDGESPLKRLKLNRLWKADVIRWLRRKGICLQRMEEPGKWVRIQLQTSSRMDGPGPTNASCQECLWPAALCFFYSSNLQDEVSRALESPYLYRHGLDQRPEDGTEWFRTSSQQGFEDPLDTAQNWLLGKEDRVKTVETIKARRTREENAQMTADSTTTYPSSPLYARGSGYGDLHTAQGVYPTPPDAILAPGAGAPAGMDGVVMSASGADGQGAQNQIHNGAEALSLPDQGAVVSGVDYGNQQALMHPQESSAGGPLPENDGNDDLFEDMDEEMFGANDITEADFNFFDDGDGAGFGGLMDVSQPLAFEEPKNETPADFKFESPMAEVHDATIEQKPEVMLDVKPDLEAESTTQAKDMQPTNTGADMDAIDDFIEDQQHAVQPKDDVMEIEKVKTPRISPPLSPSRINEKLFPSPHPKVMETDFEDQDLPRLQRRESMFDAVGFSKRMELTDSKYRSTGRFNFAFESQPLQLTDKTGRPLTLHPPTTIPFAPSLSRSVTVPKSVVEEADMSDAQSEASDSYTDASTSSASMGESALSAMNAPDVASVANSKRKWAPSVVATSAVGTPGGMQVNSGDVDSIMGDADGTETEVPSLLSLEPGPSDWTLACAPPPSIKTKRRPGTADSRNRSESFPLTSAASTPSSVGSSEAVLEPLPPPLNTKEIITITQLLADQVISTTLDLLPEDNDAEFVDLTQPSGEVRDQMQAVQSAIKELFPQGSECNLLGYAQIQDVMPEPTTSSKAQPKPVPRRNNPAADPHAQMFFPMATPHVRLRRGEDMWDVLPPALSFWEPLGLAPTGGPKNVLAYCITPWSDQLNGPLESFLDNVGMSYESCKFGMHTRPPADDDFPSGVVHAEIDNVVSPTFQTCLRAMRDACARLGRCLSGLNLKEWYAKPDEAPPSWNIDALVVYIINPFTDPHSIWQLCSAFWTLFHIYASTSSAKATDESKPDVVLQLVPIKYVASFDSPVVLEPAVLNRLAREVYDRCPPKAPNDDHSALSIYSAPSIQLEEMLPKQIPFRITVEPPSDLLHENSYIHVGYAVSFDGAWLTAAWTDNPGKHQATVSYYLVNRSFAEVAREIYQTSLEIMQSRRVTWRLCIARAGVMEREEMDAWTALANSPCHLTIGTALVSIDPNPSFKITSTLPSPTAPTTTQPNSAVPPNNLGVSTPGTTPQAGVSPSGDTQHGFTPAAATPGESNPPAAITDPSQDPDARLVDVTDESWGVILSHRLHNSNSSVEFRPALASGYLVKRGAADSTITTSSNSGQHGAGNSSGGGTLGSGRAPTINTNDTCAPDTPRGPIAVGVNLLWIGATGGANARAAANINLNMNPDSATASNTPGGVPSGSMGMGMGMGMMGSGSGTPGVGGAAGMGVGAGPPPGAGAPLTPHPQAARSTYDGVLREFLVTYRGLGLLARLKGMRGTRGGAVPWHVCAAVRGVKGLERCL
ncbi:uncharacterized protein K452DRAFT_360587 [Aplosporella prunicola CBS 121167]|uniref:Mediator of RNA polymerase II transcription subunit 13 n=1 Tax=Aplosporella prunicola CBS 121167 TaxID=1176127 RepID=A0A6A6B7J1_9PEZI|nr:uncharacterized protein K452DRAFT_360587 [Aplosporella prunicola CBS 121167]KAF2139353.1 hypothetical protein K452DRAFT_360587 [Aplosporella prunicola CBS 121167]